MATAFYSQPASSGSNKVSGVTLPTKRQKSVAVRLAFLRSHDLEKHEWPSANSKLADVVNRFRARPEYQTHVRRKRCWKEFNDVESSSKLFKSMKLHDLLREFKKSYEEGSNLAAVERKEVTEINQLSRYLYNADRRQSSTGTCSNEYDTASTVTDICTDHATIRTKIQ